MPTVTQTAPSLWHLLRASSRTFAVGIERLPPALRESVCVAYLLLRVSDYLEDDPGIPDERKPDLLRLWDSVLAETSPVEDFLREIDPGPDPEADALVARHADLVFRALGRLPDAHRRILTRHVRDSTQGMARWAQRGPRIYDEADLDDYMHEVAGRVGHLLTELFAGHIPEVRARRDRMMELGREFGLGLQTVNVLRGLRADAARGWIYVPEQFTREAGLERREQMFEPEHRKAALAVVERLADKATRHLDHAAEYVRGIPRRHHAVRLFCIYPLLFADRTVAITRGNPAVLAGEAKIGRDEVRRIVRAANLFGWSNGWLGGYRRRLRPR